MKTPNIEDESTSELLNEAHMYREAADMGFGAETAARWDAVEKELQRRKER